MPSVPDHPPGPEDEEIATSTGRVWLTAEQVAFAAEFVKSEPEARAIEIVEHAAGHFKATVYDALGGVIDVRSIHPINNRLLP